MMQKKYLIILGALVLVGLPVAYWLISPLFYSVRVSEGVDELYMMAGIEKTSSPTPVPLPMMTPPAGLDPVRESNGPTEPPPSQPETMQVAGSGAFAGLAGHNGQGTAKLLRINGKYFVRFEDDFAVTNGPDLFVGFGKDGEYKSEAQLAPLKGNEGSQNYELPDSIDVSQYNEVWIWCRAFHVPFAKAVLQ